MISELFYDMLGIKYDLKAFKGSFSVITKPWPVGMPPKHSQTPWSKNLYVEPSF